MALPLAHAAAGYLVYEALRPSGAHRPRLLASAVALANAPDLDFVPGLLIGVPEAFHRGCTHTIAAALAVGAVIELVGRMLGRRPGLVARAAVLATAAWGSHLLLDFVTADVVPPSGEPLLWPLSGAYYIASRPLLSEIVLDRSGTGAFFRGLFTSATVRVWFEEEALLACALGGVQATRAIRAALAPAAGGMAEEP